jgi:hypothetical protein
MPVRPAVLHHLIGAAGSEHFAADAPCVLAQEAAAGAAG